MRLRSQATRVVALCGLLTAGTPVLPAQSPLAETITPRIEILRFAIDGNTLLKPEEIERAVAPYIGKQKDFGDIQRALEVLEQVYRELGYGMVQVLLPEQDITRGVIRLRVIEPRIGNVRVEGNRNFDTANVRASLPSLRPGAAANSREVARNLQLLAEHPAKQTTVLLKSGALGDELDATVKVSDERPLKFLVRIDNTGADSRLRTGIGVQHSNLLDRDHILDLQYVVVPADPQRTAIYAAGYRTPFYAVSGALDLVAGYSDANAGVLPGLFNVTGRGAVYGGRYTVYLSGLGEYEHKLSFGVDYRAYKNSRLPPGVAGSPGITVRPASIDYSGLWRMTDVEFGFHAGYLQNVLGDDSDFKAARPGATAGYRIWRGGMNYSQTVAMGWRLHAVMAGQFSQDALVPGEQFGFGGADSVRGFTLREVTDDRGYAGSLEIHTPELGPKLGAKDLRARLLAFYDVGSAVRNSPLPGELSGQTGASVGLGLRLNSGKQVDLRVDAAQVVNSAGSQARGDRRLHASAVIHF